MRGLTKRSGQAGDVGLVEWPMPTARAGHVVLEVLGAGICGTDLHIYKNEYKVTPPVVMGHEVCGRVAIVGDGVDPSLEGQRFVAETFFSTCGVCRHCRNGRPNLCLERKSIGSHVNGAMAPFVEVPAINLHRAPDNMSDAAASLAEPVACVTNSMFGAHSYVEPGQKVLVVGPGAIGLIAAQVARTHGADVTVRGAPSDNSRLELAAGMGFETSVVGDNLTDSSFDVVVECSGNAHGYADSLRFVARAGHVAQMGLSGKPSELPTDLICYKELTITSGFASTPCSWERAMRLINSNAIDLEALVTDRLSLDQWETGFERSFAGDGVKFVIDPQGA